MIIVSVIDHIATNSSMLHVTIKSAWTDDIISGPRWVIFYPMSLLKDLSLRSHCNQEANSHEPKKQLSFRPFCQCRCVGAEPHHREYGIPSIEPKTAYSSSTYAAVINCTCSRSWQNGLAFAVEDG